MTTTIDEHYLTPEQVCELLPVFTKDSLNQMRYVGDGPPFIKPTARRVLYPESGLRRWLDELEQGGRRRSA